MAKDERTERITLRLTPAENEVVTAVATETGLSVADVVRQALRAAHPERFKANAKRPKQPKK